MTLTDREYQRLRDAARAVMTEIGVETGRRERPVRRRSRRPGRFHVIEMNPRVSRSSRAREQGHRLPHREDRREARGRLHARRAAATTSPARRAAFEPVIDYVVVKWPRFAFEKFPGADATLGTQMKSVGEVMSIGRTFCEALQKAARSLETGKDGLVSLLGRVDYRALAEPKRRRDLGDGGAGARAARGRSPPATAERDREARCEKLVAIPTADRLFYVADAMRVGHHATQSSTSCTAIDPWFLAQIRRIVAAEERIAAGELGADAMRAASSASDSATASSPRSRARRRTTSAHASGSHGTRAVYARVDTCAAEFVARTRRTSTRRTRPRASRSRDRSSRKVVILGGGPEPDRTGDRVRLLLRPRGAWRCASSASRPSWSTATPRRCRPTTTRPTASTSSR